jgi:[ribosomal protein S5]-alanine N-acetyltransferase
MSGLIAQTSCLVLRQLTLADADFILRLVNEPSWLEFIGDKHVHNLSDAENYLRSGPFAMYASHGFGLWMVQRLSDGANLGMCGLIKRDTLENVDIGFAFFPEYGGQGYAYEAALAALDFARHKIELTRIVAITSLHNVRSIALLKKLGFSFEETRSLAVGSDPVNLFGIALN